MGLRIWGFWTDQRGTTFEGIALSVSVIAVAFVASADMLDYMTKPRAAPAAVVAQQPAVPATVANADLDQAPTGSLPQLITRSVLDPCTGRIK